MFDLPILLPVSRKTVIGDVLGIADPARRDAGTIACIVAGLRRGASIFRVHNVAAAKQALDVLAPIAVPDLPLELGAAGIPGDRANRIE